MFEWLLTGLLLLAAGGILCALGVGTPMWSRLVPVFLLMVFVAGLIAWPFLRNRR